MIWLSATVGTQERSVYFDIRDIDVRRTGSFTEGIVRGVLGDGQREFWGEVSLGEAVQVSILPFWEEDEKPTCFDEGIDPQLLQEQLAESVVKVFHGIVQLTADGRLQHGNYCCRSTATVAA